MNASPPMLGTLRRTLTCPACPAVSKAPRRRAQGINLQSVTKDNNPEPNASHTNEMEILADSKDIAWAQQRLAVYALAGR